MANIFVKAKYFRKFVWRALGRCYHCGHSSAKHLSGNIRECKHGHCDCFGFDAGPDSWSEK